MTLLVWFVVTTNSLHADRLTLSASAHRNLQLRGYGHSSIKALQWQCRLSKNFIISIANFQQVLFRLQMLYHDSQTTPGKIKYVTRYTMPSSLTTNFAYANLCITTLQIGMTLGTASFLGLLLLTKLPVKLHLGMQFVMTKAFSTWPL